MTHISSVSFEKREISVENSPDVCMAMDENKMDLRRMPFLCVTTFKNTEPVFVSDNGFIIIQSSEVNVYLLGGLVWLGNCALEWKLGTSLAVRMNQS